MNRSRGIGYRVLGVKVSIRNPIPDTRNPLHDGRNNMSGFRDNKGSAPPSGRHAVIYGNRIARDGVAGIDSRTAFVAQSVPRVGSPCGSLTTPFPPSNKQPDFFVPEYRKTDG